MPDKLAGNPPTCNNCKYWKPRIGWRFLSIRINHPFCTRVLDSQGQPTFAELQRMFAMKGNCGPQAVFFESKAG